MIQGVIICSPCTRPPGTPAVQRWCYLCGAAVWVSHEMHGEVDAGRLQPTCLSCADDALAHPELQGALVHPQQMQTLTALGLMDVAQSAVAAVNHQVGRRRRRAR